MFALLTFFVYICQVDIKDKVMNPNPTQSNVIFVNRLTNIVYKDGEILETIINKKKDSTPKDVIFDIFARVITRNGDERKVLYHVIFDKEDYTNKTLTEKLSKLYAKSTKTYQRAINSLCLRRIIKHNKNKVIKSMIDYDLSLLDLDDVKSVIIHIV